MNKLELDLLRHALEPEELAEYLSVSRRLADNSRAIPTKVAQGIELGDLLSELTGGLAPRLATAESAATGDRRERNAAELPWVHKASPKAILQDLERLQWYNDRIIAFTSQMVMKHSVAGQLLATQKLAALSVMERQEQEPGKSLMTFVRRLKGAGLKAESVKDMPNAVIAALAATLNGEMANDLSDALGIAKSERDREDAGEPEDDLDVLQKQAAALKAEIDGFSAYRNLQALVPDEPPVHLQPDEWNYEHGDLPRELWSVIFEPIQYRFEDRPATAEEEREVVSMPLPAAHDWATLFERDVDFNAIALYPIRRLSSAQLNIRDLFAERLARDPSAVDGNTVRAWLFLLLGRQLEPDEHDRFFGRAYFDGVTLPLASLTPNMVRVLRWVGDD